MLDFIRIPLKITIIIAIIAIIANIIALIVNLQLPIDISFLTHSVGVILMFLQINFPPLLILFPVYFALLSYPFISVAFQFSIKALKFLWRVWS